MMKKIVTSPFRKLKVLLILPVFAIILYSFSKPEYRYISVNEKEGVNAPMTVIQSGKTKVADIGTAGGSSRREHSVNQGKPDR